MMKLPTKPKTKVEEEGEGRYKVRMLFPIDSQAEFDALISAALKENDTVIHSDWEARTVTVAAKDITAYERKINFFRVMGIPDNTKR